MKLIKFENRTEGDKIPEDSLFIFGRNKDSNNKFNGWYIVFNSPKYYINEYITDSFEKVTGICSDRYMIMVRKCSNNKWTTIINWAVSPIYQSDRLP